MEVANANFSRSFELVRDGELTVELIELLEMIQQEQTINNGDINGVTLLHVAAWNGNLRIFKKLMDMNDVQLVEDSNERTVLQGAILGEKIATFTAEEKAVYFKVSNPDPNQQFEIVRSLLGHEGVNINQKLTGENIIRLAVRANVSLNLFTLLLTDTNLVLEPEERDQVLDTAVRYDRIRHLQVLANWDWPEFNLNCVSPQNYSLLGLAVNGYSIRSLKFLLDRPEVDVNFMGVIEYGPTECNPFILCMIGSTDSEEKRVLMEHKLRMMMEHPRLDINAGLMPQGECPIHRAVLLPDPFFLKIMLQSPVLDVNVLSGGEYSPIAFAALMQYDTHMDLLLTHPRTVLVDATTPAIFEIVQNGNVKLLAKCLAAGGNPNSVGFIPSNGMWLTLFEANLQLCVLCTGRKELRDRKKMGALLIEAGARPNLSPIVVQEIRVQLRSGEISSFCKRAMKHLMYIRKHKVTSLCGLARHSIFEKFRSIRGPHPAYDLLEKLIETEHLPATLKTYMTFDRAIEVKHSEN